MNLTSCKQCGVVLDKDKLIFPDTSDEEGMIDTTKCIWDGQDYIAFVPCPVCKFDILETN